MGAEYAHEKFGDAVRALATTRGSIKERLVDAVNFITSINTETDVPEDLVEAFNDFVQRMTSAGSQISDEGKIQTTVGEMTEDEAVEAAREIVWLAHQFELALPAERKA